jgi:hypothetical protein
MLLAELQHVGSQANPNRNLATERGWPACLFTSIAHVDCLSLFRNPDHWMAFASKLPTDRNAHIESESACEPSFPPNRTTEDTLPGLACDCAYSGTPFRLSFIRSLTILIACK